jgi:hypothetical protein
VFRQINQDKLIEMGAHPAEASFPPLVRISASRAAGIVRRETVRKEPFVRYYFHDSALYLPDYTLILDFLFTGGERKQLSIPGQMGAGFAIAFGVNVLCNPTNIILDATLSDHSGNEVRRFRIERTFSFSGELRADCRDDEFTNPDAVSSLVKALYTEMEEDGTLASISAQTSPAH